MDEGEWGVAVTQVLLYLVAGLAATAVAVSAIGGLFRPKKASGKRVAD